jgi:hypothetical protein
LNLIDALKTGRRIRNQILYGGQWNDHEDFRFFYTDILSNDWEVEPEPNKKVKRWLWFSPITKYTTDYFYTEEEALEKNGDGHWKKLEWSMTEFDE